MITADVLAVVVRAVVVVRVVVVRVCQQTTTTSVISTQTQTIPQDYEQAST